MESKRTVGATVLALFAMAVPAIAMGMTYPGSFCQRPDGTASYDALTYQSLGGIRNAESQAVNVICPIFRPYEDIPAGANFLTDATIVVRDRSSTQDITCTIYARLNNTTLIDSDSKTSTSVDSGTAYELTGFSLTNDGGLQADVMLYLVCSLPPVRWIGATAYYSEIISYSIDTNLSP